MNTLDGKIALVTGAARGIGRAIALRLAAEGAQVAVHYGSSKDDAAGLVAEIEKIGGSAFAFQATFGQAGDATQLWSTFDEHADGLDILVNNAGILGGRTPFADVDESMYDAVFAINTKAPFFLVQRRGSVIVDGS